MSSNASPLEPQTPASSAPLQLLASRNFIDWLGEQRVSLGFTTYQANKLFLLGLKADGSLAANERTFQRCMGLWTDPEAQTLWMATQFQLWRLDNMLDAGVTREGGDRLFVPRVGYTTGDIDTHDVARDDQGRVVFVSTLFSCLATVDDHYNFRPLWRPPFISKLAAEDRCHLNGLAMRDGRPRWVTACSQSDLVDGWRDHRGNGGCVIDVPSGQVVLEGLSMPHSPRWYRDRLWLLDSGRGDFGYVDLDRGTFQPVAFCSGYARGLTFVGDYAVVGISRPREQTFQGLALDERLAAHKARPRCGLLVVDLQRGDVAHWLRMDGPVEELYDIVTLPGVRRPRAWGFQTDELRRTVWFPDDGRVAHWSGGPR